MEISEKLICFLSLKFGSLPIGFYTLFLSVLVVPLHRDNAFDEDTWASQKVCLFVILGEFAE